MRVQGPGTLARARGALAAAALTTALALIATPRAQAQPAPFAPPAAGGWIPAVADPAHNHVGAARTATGTTLVMQVGRLDPKAPAAWQVAATRRDPAYDHLAPATSYALRFQARASVRRSVAIELFQARPYASAGLSTRVDVDTAPTPCVVTFRTPATLPAGPIELGVYAGDEMGDLQIGEPTLAPLAIRTYAGEPLAIAAFAAGESWTAGAADYAHARGAASGLRLACGANDARFAAHEVALDLSAPDGALSWWVYTDTPATIGRMYVMLHSGADTEAHTAFFSYSGLQSGWNHLVAPRALMRSYAWMGGLDWAHVRQVGFKLESNGNGPAAVTLADLSIALTARAGPVSPRADHVNVRNVTASSATVTWNSTLDGASGELACGTDTGYGAARAAANGARPEQYRVVLTALRPATLYHCRIHLHDAAAGDGYSGDFTFRTEAAAPCVRAGAGAAPFPLGLYEVGAVDAIRRGDLDDVRLVARTPYTTLTSYGLSDCGVPEAMVQAVLDTAAAWHRRVALGFCPDWLNGATPNLAAVRARIARFGAHPALAAWLAYDEPDLARGAPMLARSLADAHTAIHAADPRHPVEVVVSALGTPADYAGTADRLGSDLYPVPFQPIDAIVPTLAALQRSGKPFTFTFQGYSTDIQHWPGLMADRTRAGRYPSYDEMRAMAYLAVVYGASGLWQFDYSYVNDAPGSEWHWADMLRLAREIEDLAPILGAPTTPGIVTGVSTDRVHAAAKRAGSNTYVIAVNTDAAPRTADVRLVGARGARDLLGGGVLPVRSGAARITLRAFGVAVLQLVP